MAFTQMRALSRVCLCLTFSEAFGAHSLKLWDVGDCRWWMSPAIHCHQCCHGVNGVGGGMSGGMVEGEITSAVQGDWSRDKPATCSHDDQVGALHN